MDNKKPKPAKKILTYLLTLAAIVVLYLIIGCPFRFIIGVPCPGCGMTRAWLSFFRGQPANAVKWHPLFFLAPFFVIPFVFKVSKKVELSLYIVLTLLLVLVYIVRMCRMFPVEEPMVFNSGALLNRFYNIIQDLLKEVKK